MVFFTLFTLEQVRWIIRLGQLLVIIASRINTCPLSPLSNWYNILLECLVFCGIAPPIVCSSGFVGLNLSEASLNSLTPEPLSCFWYLLANNSLLSFSQLQRWDFTSYIDVWFFRGLFRPNILNTGVMLCSACHQKVLIINWILLIMPLRQNRTNTFSETPVWMFRFGVISW